MVEKFGIVILSAAMDLLFLNGSNVGVGAAPTGLRAF
jgi:hypothetical protein